MNVASIRIGPGASRSRTAERKVGRQNAAIRQAAAAAERYLDANETEAQDEDEGVLDDAPLIDDLPEWVPDDENDVVLGDDERDPLPPSPSWMPWVRLSIYWSDGQLHYRVHIPPSEDPDIEFSLGILADGWAAIAQTLIRVHERALAAPSALEAVKLLSPYPMKDLERSVGQGSRDKRVVINTPFGLTPLWLFAQGRADALFSDLQLVGQMLLTEKPDKLTKQMISRIIRRPSVQPDTIRRAHGQALLAVIRHPEVVSRHRALWPLTTPEALLDDLGVEGATGRSVPVGTLALVGAFDSQAQVTARAAGRPPQREAQS